MNGKTQIGSTRGLPIRLFIDYFFVFQKEFFRTIETVTVRQLVQFTETIYLDQNLFSSKVMFFLGLGCQSIPMVMAK